MSVDCTNEQMISDLSGHRAWRVDAERDLWELSWLPGRIMDEAAAMMAMVVTEAVIEIQYPDLPGVHDPVVMRLIDGTAASLGLTTSQMWTRITDTQP